MSANDGMTYPESSQAVVVFVLGILGVMLCQLLAPIAWIVGNGELRGIAEGRRPPQDRGLASAGRVLGIIGTVLLGLGLLFGLGFLVLAGAGILNELQTAT